MIEQQVREHLIASEELEPFMATYAGQLAVFNQEAPDDHKAGWGKASQYGRAVFYIDMKDDPERNISGTMGLDFYCESGRQVPEEVEPVLRSLIDGYFFSNEEVTIAARWATSQYFSDPTKKIIGVTLVFDLLAFPTQETTYPDPVGLINSWAKDALPAIIGTSEIRVIGMDSLPAAWKPTDETPAIYWRLGTIGKCTWIPDNYNASWHTARIWGHVMATERSEEMKIARLVQNTLTIRRRLIFDDMSPLMVDRNINLTSSNDPLRVGQLSLDGTYGVLNVPSAVEKMYHITVKEGSI